MLQHLVCLFQTHWDMGECKFPVGTGYLPSFADLRQSKDITRSQSLVSLQQVCFKVFYVWDNISIPQFVLVKIAALMRLHQPLEGLSTESVPFFCHT